MFSELWLLSLTLSNNFHSQVYNIFPYLGFLLRANKTILRNREEFHEFLQVTFVEYLKNLDKNDQRSFIDAFLVKQQEVTEYFLADSIFYGSMKTFAIFFPPLQLQLNFFREAVFEKIPMTDTSHCWSSKPLLITEPLFIFF